MQAIHKSTKATSITAEVKKNVAARDSINGHTCCVLCGSPEGQPNAHYISRAQGGRGIEENIVTLCAICHRRYDQTPDRPKIRAVLKTYLKSRYPNWDEHNLIYKKRG